MANLIFLLVLAVTTCVTLAKNVGPDDDLDFTCDYAYGARYLLPFKRYYDTQSTLVKGSRRLKVTLPVIVRLFLIDFKEKEVLNSTEFGRHSAVWFVCVNITDADTETTDVTFSVTNDRFVNVLVTLDEEAQNNVIVDIRAIIVDNFWLILQMLK